MLSPAIRQTLEQLLPLLDTHVASALHARWDALLKAPGSFGRLEDLVVHYGIIRGAADPSIRRKGLYVFCADHGVEQEGVSSGRLPSTADLVAQFVHGVAPASILCRHYAIEPVVVDAGLRGSVKAGVLDARIGDGTANFARTPAMTIEQTNRALETGIEMARDAACRFDVAGLAQIGLGATTSAAALFTALSARDPSETVTRPPGLDDSAFHRKLAVVRTSVARHSNETITPFGALRCLGGFDIAAMTGFLIGAATVRLPVVVDCFTGGVAALLARSFNADSLDAAIFANHSGDPAHGHLFATLHVEPNLRLDLKAGAGCGAALAIHLLETGLKLFHETGYAA